MIYTNTNIKKAGHNWYQTDKKSISGFMKNYSYFIFKASLDYQLNINQTSKKFLLYTPNGGIQPSLF